jgi:hypothetical protein
MAELFKKQTTVWRRDGVKVPPGTPGATKEVIESRKWYATIKGKATPLSTDKTVAKRMLAKLTTDADLAGVGLTDPYAVHRKRPLLEHLEDYRRELEARDNAPRYVSAVISRLAMLLSGCGFVFTSDLSASRVMEWLANLRRKRQPRVTLETGKEWYTLKEAAAVLGIKPASVGTAVRRHRLVAVGQGKGSSD